MSVKTFFHNFFDVGGQHVDALKLADLKEAQPEAKYWFWAADQIKPNDASKGTKPEPSDAPQGTTSPEPASAEKQVLELLTKNPGINGSTLLNLLKVNGLMIVDAKPETPAPAAVEPATEAMGSSDVGVGVLAANPLKRKKESSPFSIRAKLMESSKPGNDGVGPTRFRAILIQEGLGNFKDAFYYTRDALQSAVPVFEGKKIYADHPAADEEQTRPERSVKDILGHFENVALEESEDGRAMLAADLVLMPDRPYEWARALVRHAIEYSEKYPDKDFVGLSINANGDASEAELESFMQSNTIPESAKPKLMQAIEQGVSAIRVVTEIDAAVSCDLVTEAGAGGRISQMLEGEKMKKENEEKKETKHEGDAPEHKDAPKPAPKHDAPAADDKKDSDGDADDAKEAGDEKHDDEEQDKKLIAEMLKKYLGDGPHDEHTEGLAHEALKAAKEMGHEGEEAMKCAGYSMAMAKHMASKQAKHEGEEGKKESEEKAKESEESKKDESKKESEVIALAAEVAALKEKLKKHDIADHLEKKLAESGLPRAATKLFRERLGTPKSAADIDDKLALFCEAYTRGGEADGLSFVISAEKQDRKTGGFSLSDCVND